MNQEQLITAELEIFILLNNYVLGTSGGSIIGLNLASRIPQMIRALIADSFVGQSLTQELVQQLVVDREELTPEKVIFWEIAHGEDWKDVIQSDTDLFIRALQSEESLISSFDSITCPVLFTGSLRDDLLPYIEKGICHVARQVPSSKVILYPDGGHPLMWSSAIDFRTEVERFFNEIR